MILLFKSCWIYWFSDLEDGLVDLKRMRFTLLLSLVGISASYFRALTLLVGCQDEHLASKILLQLSPKVFPFSVFSLFFVSVPCTLGWPSCQLLSACKYSVSLSYWVTTAKQASVLFYLLIFVWWCRLQVVGIVALPLFFDAVISHILWTVKSTFHELGLGIRVFWHIIYLVCYELMKLCVW